jgi:hypothetical protein
VLYLGTFPGKAVNDDDLADFLFLQTKFSHSQDPKRPFARIPQEGGIALS